MQSKSRDVAHEGSTMKIDYNTRFLLAVRRKRKIIGYFIGHSEATAQDRISTVEASRYLCIGKIVASKIGNSEKDARTP